MSYTSSKNSYNEYKSTVPRAAVLINKNQLSNEKTSKNTGRENILYFYIFYFI